MEPATREIPIEVACATPRLQRVVALAVPAGSTLAEAIAASGVLAEFPEIGRYEVGVFGRLRQPDEPVQAGDRVEILRPLIADPKQARRQRARTGHRPKV